jgi:diguanylate cyclase
MISVMDAVDDLDRQSKAAVERERLLRKCLSFWQQSLLAVEEHVFPLFPGAAKKTEEDWHQVHACLGDNVPEAVLDSTPRLVERVLHNYALESRRTQREELDGVKAVLAVMAAAAESARTRSDSQSGDLAGVCDSLGQLAHLDNLDQLRQQLSHEAAHLRESVSRMVKENQEALAAMEADLTQFRTRLAAAETAAATDALTGLANRRELERQLENRIQSITPFCALLFDLDHFKSINDRFGHECGDQVLRQFADVLNEQVRPGDVIARWGGDEFFVVFDCTLKDALRRCQQISEKLSRRYEIHWQGKSILLPVRSSSGVVEYCRGETATELFRRADAAMYAAKAQRAKADS